MWQGYEAEEPKYKIVYLHTNAHKELMANELMVHLQYSEAQKSSLSETDLCHLCPLEREPWNKVFDACKIYRHDVLTIFPVGKGVFELCVAVQQENMLEGVASTRGFTVREEMPLPGSLLRAVIIWMKCKWQGNASKYEEVFKAYKNGLRYNSGGYTSTALVRGLLIWKYGFWKRPWIYQWSSDRLMVVTCAMDRLR